MGRRRLCLPAAAVALLVCLLAPATAQATFHLIKVREVYPGSVAAPASQYVELQMYAGGQNHVGGHSLRLYDASGAVTSTSTFAADVAGSATQSTIVLATHQAEEQFGFSADAPLTVSSPAQLDPAGGAACWEALDCVSWGDFSGSLPSPAGAPAAPAGIPDGMAIRRSISQGCSTLLEPVDDSDNSSADFALSAPEPRPNSVSPSETRCAAGGTGGGSGASSQGGDVPQTTLRRKPPKQTADRTPTFRFASSGGARFECKLDGKRYRTCRSPFTAKRLALGPHRFRVRAVGQDGAIDPTPASCRFRVVRPAR